MGDGTDSFIRMMSKKKKKRKMMARNRKQDEPGCGEGERETMLPLGSAPILVGVIDLQRRKGAK